MFNLKRYLYSKVNNALLSLQHTDNTHIHVIENKNKLVCIRSSQSNVVIEKKKRSRHQ